MVTRFFLLLFLTLPFLAICHDGIIKGVVKDPVTYLPLYGATVILEGKITKGTFTDQFGAYKFTSLDAGKYTVTISHLGFEKIVLQKEILNEESTSDEI